MPIVTRPRYQLRLSLLIRTFTRIEENKRKNFIYILKFSWNREKFYSVRWISPQVHLFCFKLITNGSLATVCTSKRIPFCELLSKAGIKKPSRLFVLLYVAVNSATFISLIMSYTHIDPSLIKAARMEPPELKRIPSIFALLFEISLNFFGFDELFLKIKISFNHILKQSSIHPKRNKNYYS